MTMTSWQKLFGFGACMALFAAACTVSSGDGDEDDEVTTGIGGSGGSGGSGGTAGDGGSGGTSTTNTSTATVTNTATTTSTTTGGGGTGGSEPDPVDCLDGAGGGVPGDVATCEPTDNDSCCTKCVAANCCESYSECFASDPYNICGGSGQANDSEIDAFITCMIGVEDGAIPGLDEGSDFENCIAEVTSEVSAAQCGNGTISGPTNELAVCIHGDDDGLDGCFLECLTDFDETECTY